MNNVQVLHNAHKDRIQCNKLKFQWGEDLTTDVSLKLSYLDSNLIIDFDVTEIEIRKQATHNNDKVYEDSCVECFFKIPNSDEYYNFEASATSFMLVARGSSRKNRVHLDNTIIKNIDRQVSILNETPGECHWKIRLSIDLIEWGLLEKGVDIKNHFIEANFYKCGDKLKTPHYLSLFDIDSDTPNFHTPNSFGKLIFV